MSHSLGAIMESEVPRLRTYRVFISHCWEYAWHYHRLVEFLNEEPLFRWENLSISEERALREDEEFEYHLRNRVRKAHILLVVVGMEVAQRNWIKWELEWARILGIPVVGVMPNGKKRFPKAIEKAACDIVGWRRDSIIGAVREWALNRE